MKNSFRMAGRIGPHPLYVALAGLLTVSAWAALAHGDVRVVDLFAANLTAEILGLLVTLVLVQRYLERQERAQRLRGSMGGVRRAGRALEVMASAWAELVKGAAARVPEPRPAGLAELFAEDMTSALAHLDPEAESVHGTAAALREARATLRGVISTYGAGLDPIYLAAIDDLADDAFLDLFATVDRMRAQTPRALRAARHDRTLHFDRLLLALDWHNRIAADAARLRDRRTAPRGGAWSAALPPDVDLRVHTGLNAEWWSVAPRPGTLRSVRFRDAALPDPDTTARHDVRSRQVKVLSDNDIRDAGSAERPFPVEAVGS